MPLTSGDNIESIIQKEETFPALVDGVVSTWAPSCTGSDHTH